MIKNQFYILILFMFWLVASSWFYVSEIKEVFPDRLSLAKTQYPVFFKYSNSDVHFGNEFNSFKDFTLKKLEPNNRLLIKGSYTLGEYNNTSHPNLGIARAINASKLFNQVNKSQILTMAQLRDSSYNQNFKNSQWVNAIDFKVLTSNNFIEENAHGARLSLSQNLNHPKVQAYLKYIAIENSDSYFSLFETSMIDSDSVALNCISIKDQLLLNGINSSQVNILPMLLDSTKNPYLEIYINKSQSNEY